MYLSNLLMNRSPRAFARVPALTRVNDSDTFILTQMHQLEVDIIYIRQSISDSTNAVNIDISGQIGIQINPSVL